MTTTHLPNLCRRIIDRKEHAETVANICKILSDFGIRSSDSVSEVGVEVKNLTRAILAKSGSAKCKVAALELMSACFLTWKGDENGRILEVPQLEKTITNIIVQVLLLHQLIKSNINCFKFNQPSKNVPSVRKAANESLGCLCKCYPDSVVDHMDTIYNYFEKQMFEQMSSKTKQPDLPIIEGLKEL